MVEDATRRIIFSPSIVRSTEQKPPVPEETYQNERTVYIPQPKVLPPVSGMKQVGKWNLKWDRDIQIFTPFGVVNITQHLQSIGAKSVRIDSTKTFPWSSNYLTSELDKKMIDDLIATHPSSQKTLEKGSLQSFARMQKYALFLYQAGRYEDALKAIEVSEAEFDGKPEFVAKIGEIRKKAYEQIQHIKVVQAKTLLAEGYPEATINLLGSVTENQTSESDLVDLRSAKAKAEKEMALFREIREALGEVGKELGSQSILKPPYVEQLVKNVSPVDNPKLEPFLSQYKQWKNQGKNHDPRELDKLASLGLTAWSMGASAADPNPTSAKRIWDLRTQLQSALSELTVQRKSGELRALQKKYPEKTTVDDITVLLGSLGPIDPDPAPPRFPESPVRREYPDSFGLPGGAYLVQVPQHYEPAVPAPVIVVLGAIGESQAEILIRWRELANREGYILAAPEWAEGSPPSKYQYSVREQDRLLGCIRDLRSRYRVDSDRLFLVGNLEGAQMAFDFALGHPDLFAGVVPISASPRFFAEKYWRNGVYLPFYVVTGDRTGEVFNQVKDLFNNWATRGYNSLWVQYKGRGLDWFHGEIPNILAWMKDKKRTFPLRTLGSDGNGGVFGNEFRTMRVTDNRFYWLEAVEIHPRNIASPPPGFDPRVSPATLFARAEPEKNEVIIKTSGIKKLAFLIQRNSKGECCLNLDKPVTIRWNLDQLLRNQKITIDMELLLEDQAKWQDRQRLLLGRLELGAR